MAERPVAMFEIKKYMIIWRQEEKAHLPRC